MSHRSNQELTKYLATASHRFDHDALRKWNPGDREKEYARTRREIVALVGTDGAPIHQELLENAREWTTRDASATDRLRSVMVEALSEIEASRKLLLDLAVNPWASPRVGALALYQLGKTELSDSERKIILGIAYQRSRTDELRAAALRVLVARGVTDVLPILAESPNFEDWLPSREDLLLMRAELGDTTVLRPLICAAYGPEDCQLVVTITRETVSAFEAKLGGTCAALTALGSGDPSQSVLERLVSLAILDPEMGPWALERLLTLDPLFDVGRMLFDHGDSIAFDIAGSLSRSEAPPLSTLQHLAGDQNATRTQRLWATYTRLLLGDFGAHSAWAGIEHDRVVVPGLDADVRGGIIRRYASRVCRGSAVRWLIEAQEILLATYDEDPDRQIAARADGLDRQMSDYSRRYDDLDAALRAAGITRSPRGGSGMYVDSLPHDARVLLSSCGPFVSFYSLWHRHDPVVETCKRAAQGAGFVWCDDAMLGVALPGLMVEGLDSPTVGQLLFP